MFTDDGQGRMAIAHPEPSTQVSGELKNNNNMNSSLRDHGDNMLTRWRRFDYAITRISHRPHPEYARD